MRFPATPRFILIVPWWLAIFAYLMWAAVLLLWTMGAVVLFAAQSVWLGGRWCWARWQAREH